MATDKKDVYDIVLERIEKSIEAGGLLPWQKPWRTTGGMWPRNLKSNKPYRGINVFFLAMQGYASPYWLTYKQAQELGGQVRKGEKSTMITFWARTERKVTNQDTGETEKKPSFLLRYYYVFNSEQVDGLDHKRIREMREAVNPSGVEFNSIEECEKIVAGYDVQVQHGGDRACYQIIADTIQMPAKTQFDKSQDYYAVLFHEMVHSTGSKKRLDRSTLVDMCRFGDTNYSKEELVAEMGAAFLCGIAGIENDVIDRSAAYLDHWMSKLREEPKLLVHAAAQAQRAVDFILGVKFEEESE